MKKNKLYLIFLIMAMSLLLLSGCGFVKLEDLEKSTFQSENSTDVVWEEEQTDIKWPYYEITKDGETKGYLMGTIHIGKEEMYPFPEQISNNLKNSQNFITEIKMSELKNEETVQLIESKYYGNESITNSMDEKTKEKFFSIIDTYGIGEEDLDNVNRLGLTQVINGLATIETAPFGVDIKLSEITIGVENQENIPLETIDEQFNILKEFNDSLEIDKWVDSLETLDEVTMANEELLNDYFEGNIAKKYENAKKLGLTDEQYNILLTKRNLNWIEKLPQYLQNENQSFIAVGAGHLSGKTGLLELLKEKGYEVNYIELD